MRYIASFVGWSGTGKTTLLSALIAELKRRGARVAVVKKTNHHIGDDRSGSDTDIFRRSGSEEVALAGPGAVRINLHRGLEPEEVPRLFPEAQYILAEGLFLPGHPCIEVIGKRSGQEGPKRPSSDISAYAVNTSGAVPPFVAQSGKPLLNAAETTNILRFLEESWEAK
jgi:molybdopterin-guanine dinucleotide biosynthesis protein A/molybdopterin-guanine dinucleotide biosynthesis protein